MPNQSVVCVRLGWAEHIAAPMSEGLKFVGPEEVCEVENEISGGHVIFDARNSEGQAGYLLRIFESLLKCRPARVELLCDEQERPLFLQAAFLTLSKIESINLEQAVQRVKERNRAAA